MTDRNVERFGVLTSQRHDLADRLPREGHRCTAAGCIAQTGRDPLGCRRIPPPAAPVIRRLAPNPQSLCRFVDADAGCGQQDDPSAFRQLLWRGMRPREDRLSLLPDSRLCLTSARILFWMAVANATRFAARGPIGSPVPTRCTRLRHLTFSEKNPAPPSIRRLDTVPSSRSEDNATLTLKSTPCFFRTFAIVCFATTPA